MVEGGGREAAAAARFGWLAVALGLAALAYAFPLPGIAEEGRRQTAVMALVATLWIAEVVPIAVTALVGPALAVLVGVAPAEKAFAAFGSPILLLFIGSFLLARLTFKSRLNERIAYGVLSSRVVGSDPTRVFVLLGLTTAAISAWMSNVAVTAMMLPIAEAVLVAMLGTARRGTPSPLATAFVLIVTYSASIGGLFTPVGTPPNLIGIGLIEQATGYRIGFGEWIVAVLPVALAILLLMIGYFVWTFRAERAALVYDRGAMVARLVALGAWRRAEARVAVALLCTVALWILPPLIALLHAPAGAWLAARIPEAVVPLLVAGPLFFVSEGDANSPPLMTIEDLTGIDWPVVVLFGGGMCLGQLMMQSGMAAALGTLLAQWVPAGHSVSLVFIFCLLAIVVSETTSNTASANMVVPVVAAVSTQVGADAVGLGLAATVACSFGFMLPVSTPTNAMAYATGRVTQRQMIRHGIVLDVLGIVLLTLWFGWART